MIIAMDGPAASGKGTLAKRLGLHFGIAVLDTGSLYRAVACAVVAADADPADPMIAEKAARNLEPDLYPDAVLRAPHVGETASVVAAHKPVRAALIEFQRAFAAQPGGAVLDGRDIGTVVLPDAGVKIYVDAAPEVRAERRLGDLIAQGIETDLEAVLADIQRRDERDMGRATAPLKQAPDAHLLDTTALDIEASFRKAVDIVTRNR
ncbi:MAG: (d)CMP kinase [Pseudomonadota bacterium]